MTNCPNLIKIHGLSWQVVDPNGADKDANKSPIQNSTMWPFGAINEMGRRQASIKANSTKVGEDQYSQTSKTANLV